MELMVLFFVIAKLKKIAERSFKQKTTMKIIQRHLHHRPSASLKSLIETRLEEIGKTRKIDEARIVTAHRSEASPSFMVSAHLVTPGPDVITEAADHTIRAAFEKTVVALAAKIERLHTKGSRNLRSTVKSSHIAGRSPGGSRK